MRRVSDITQGWHLLENGCVEYVCMQIYENTRKHMHVYDVCTRDMGWLRLVGFLKL